MWEVQFQIALGRGGCRKREVVERLPRGEGVSNRSWARGVPEDLEAGVIQLGAPPFQIALGRGGAGSPNLLGQPGAGRGCFKSLLGEGGAGSDRFAPRSVAGRFQIALGRGGCRKAAGVCADADTIVVSNRSWARGVPEGSARSTRTSTSGFKSLLGEGGAGRVSYGVRYYFTGFKSLLGEGGAGRRRLSRRRPRPSGFKSLLGEGGAGRRREKGVGRVRVVSNRSWARGVPEAGWMATKATGPRVSNRSWARGVPEAYPTMEEVKAELTFQIALGRGGCRKP